MTVQLPDIEAEIIKLEAGAFQVLCDELLGAKGYGERSSTGRKLGTRKTIPGTPDTLFHKDGYYYFSECTTQASNLVNKVNEDIAKCLDSSKTGVPLEEVKEINYFSGAKNLLPKEHRKIDECVSQHGISLKFYGPSAIADMIYHDFPWLSSIHLGIDIGAKEITDYVGFLKFYDADSAGPTLSNAFIQRKNEEEALERLIASKDIVIIAGDSGVGKTKIALEVGKRYADANDYQFLCVRGSQNVGYPDISRALAGSSNNLVFLDDVNKISGFVNMLQYVSHTGNAKLILTVRSYMLSGIMQAICDILSHSYIFDKVDTISIPALGDENIDKLVRESFGITHSRYLKQVKEIARGNARLAVMACEIVEKDKTLVSIMDASSLFQYYYSDLINNYLNDYELLQVAGLVALLTPLDLEDSEFLDALSALAGIQQDELKALLSNLCDLEIVDLVRNRAAAFSDQSLQTYIVKKVFIDNRLISLSSIIIEGYKKRPQAIIESINSLLQVFRSKETHDFIKEQIVAVWEYFEKEQDVCLDKFSETFCVFNPEKALLIVKDEIAAMAVEGFDASDIDFSKAMASLVSSHCLAILNSFGRGDFAGVSLQFILQYFMKKPSDGLQVYRTIIESFCFDPDFLKHTYAREKLVADSMIQFIQDHPSRNNEVLFIEVAKYLLGTNISIARHARGNAFEMINGSLPASSEMEEYRTILWKELSRLYAKNGHRSRIDTFMLDYSSHSRRYGEENAKIFESDLESLNNFLKSNYQIGSVRQELIVDCILGNLHRAGVDISGTFIESFSGSKYANVLHVLQAPRFTGEDTWDAREKKRAAELGKYAKTLDESGVDDLIEVWKTSVLLDKSFDTWEINNSLMKIIEALSGINELLFVSGCRKILESGVYFSVPTCSITERLIETLGIDGTFDSINVEAYAYRDVWLYCYFRDIPEELLSEGVLNCLLFYLANAVTCSMSQIPQLNILDLFKYKTIDENFLKRACSIVFEKSTSNPNLLGMFCHWLFNHPDYSPSDVIVEFQGDNDLLKSIYFCLDARRGHFDHDRGFLREMLRQDICSVEEALRELTRRDELYSSFRTDELGFMWEEPNYIDLANEVFDWFCEFEPHLLAYSQYPFSSVPDEHADRFDAWIKQAIKAFAQDETKIKRLSEAICDLDDDLRLGYIQCFLNENDSFEIFEGWALFSFGMSGSPSFIPALEQQLQFLGKLLKLLNDPERLEHRAYIKEKIAGIKKEIKYWEVRDFLNKFS